MLARALLPVAALVSTTTEAASNVVRYTHDAVGNIVAIRRVDPAPVAISGFAPTAGVVGTLVTVSGTGFGRMPADNRVTFNGMAAGVVTASATSLVVAVPAGAGTGRIAVTAAGNTAISAQDFIVVAPGAPTIAGFTPAAGLAGATVTVAGTNFDPGPSATTVSLNRNAATASLVTPTQLAFAVPAATGSGRIRVATRAGNAVSAGDFIVPPGGIAATDIIATTRLAVDGPARSVGVLASDKYGLLLFDGSAGDWLSLQLGNFAINPAGATVAYTIYKPDNKPLAGGRLSAGDLSVHLPQLPTAGTYAVLLGTGIAQVSLDARLEANRILPSGGTATAVLRGAGQSTRALIAAAAGERQALMVAELTTIPTGIGLDYTIALPSGSTFRKGPVGGQGSTAMLPPFTVTGTHTVVIAPSAGTTQTRFSVGLLPGVALPIDGAAAGISIAKPGEGARLDFAGTAGENLGLGITGLVLDPAVATKASIAVYKPDATLLTALDCHVDGTKCAANLTNLPVTGNYSIIAQPANGATGTLQAWLSRDVAGTLASGTPFSLALARPGQNARLTFAGTAGTPIAIQVRGVATNPPTQGILVVVSQPDGTWLTYTHLTERGQTLVAPPLPVTGTYTVFLEPQAAAKGAATASMEVLLDPGQNLIVDGPTVHSTIAVAGGSARWTFAATAGQNLGLGVSNLALSAAADATVFVYKPDGTTLTTGSCAANPGRCAANLAKLPGTGTYGVVVRPASGATGSFSITLTTDLGGTLPIGGAALPISLDRPGRNARLTFAGAAGQTLRLNWSAVAIAGAPGNALMTINRPDDSPLGAAFLANGIAGSYDIPALPASGSYTLFIDPAAGATLSATLTLVAR